MRLLPLLLPLASLASEVQVLLGATWNRTPFLLNVLEAAAAQNADAYAAILNLIADEDEVDDETWYAAATSSLPKDIDRAVFDVELATRFHLPRVAAHFQHFDEAIATHRKALDAACANDNLGLGSGQLFVVVGGRVYCLAELLYALRDTKGEVEPVLTDRVVGTAGPLAVLYGGNNEETISMLRVLVAFANDEKLRFVWRYAPDDTTEAEVVGGYGVDLTLKRTDYIVIDDRDIKENVATLEAGDVPFYGTLPDDIPPVAAEDIPQLGLQLASYVRASENPIDTLTTLLELLPLYAQGLADEEIEPKVRLAVDNNEKRGWNSRFSNIYVNGVPMLSQLLVFELIKAIKGEYRTVERFVESGLTVPEAKVLMAEFTSNASLHQMLRETPRYALPEDAPFWFNNVAKDSIYKDSERTLKGYYKEFQVGELPLHRANVHETVFAIPLLNWALVESALEVVDFVVKSKICQRVGILPLVESELDETLAKGFYETLATAKAEKLTRVKTRRLVKEYLNSLQDVDETTEHDETAEHDAELKKLKDVHEMFSLKQPYLIVNGVFHEFNSQWIQALLYLLARDVRHIQRYLQATGLQDVNVRDLLYDGSYPVRDPLIIPEGVPPMYVSVDPLRQLGEEQVPGTEFEGTLWVIGEPLDAVHEQLENAKRIAPLLGCAVLYVELVPGVPLPSVVFSGRYVQFTEPLSEVQLGLLVRYERETGFLDAVKAVRAVVGEEATSELVEHVVLLLTMSFYRQESFERVDLLRIDTQLAVGDKDPEKFVDIVVLVDPVLEEAQRLMAMVQAVRSFPFVNLQVVMQPASKIEGEQLPVKRFYRGVFPSRVEFANGKAQPIAPAVFEVPKDTLFTADLDVHPLWVVVIGKASADMDNIKGANSGDVRAEYVLRDLLVQGFYTSEKTPGDVVGLEVEMRHNNKVVLDTRVMESMGYLQLRALPGTNYLAMKNGSVLEEVFQFAASRRQGVDTVKLELHLLTGVSLFPEVVRREGKEAALLSDVSTARHASHADINIFSVASGHLYERFLAIMTKLVMEHTNHTVKFWLIENYMLPRFKRQLPVLAKELGFEYELVNFKWPSWLRGQREKQRTIWGYKILFLDVLFPQDLDKVIFVDADQIVRTDMQELVDVDLHGAPYGYTPMGELREEMEEFRFWNTGYWARVLGDRFKYHISALYVVDLQRFRQMGAGDRLRAHYHQLLADPASLLNLDQDLPNNLQEEIPIFSLDDDWLWCETWCDDELLARAKTIDLCNNPLTKEPKLDRARRQVTEWTEYDEEVGRIVAGIDVDVWGVEEEVEMLTDLETDATVTEVETDEEEFEEFHDEL